MSNKPLNDAASAVDHVLKLAEVATVDAAIAASSLVLTLLQQHDTCGVKADIGLVAIRHASRAASLAVEAREEHIRAHGALNVDLRKLGLAERFSKDSGPPYSPLVRSIGADMEIGVPA